MQQFCVGISTLVLYRPITKYLRIVKIALVFVGREKPNSGRRKTEFPATLPKFGPTYPEFGETKHQASGS